MNNLIDQETKQIIIQKTWCHGQAITPVYGTICFWWYVTNNFKPTSLLFAALFLPYWCFLSYRSIFVEFSYRTIIIGGVLVEIAHMLVFWTALQTQLKQTFHLLMFIASILFFIETAAFLGVVTAFRPRTINNDTTTSGRNNLVADHASTTQSTISSPGISYQRANQII